MIKPTQRQIELIASEAARCRAMEICCKPQCRAEYHEVAAALALAVDLMKERMAATNACGRYR